jgi:hypothetical protein
LPLSNKLPFSFYLVSARSAGKIHAVLLRLSCPIAASSALMDSSALHLEILIARTFLMLALLLAKDIELSGTNKHSHLKMRKIILELQNRL